MPTETTIACASSTLLADEIWTKLYSLLRPLAKTWAYHAGVPVWKGQENDVAEDIVQLTMYKIFAYLQTCCANGTSIGSLERLSLVAAKRCFLDMRRRELRFLHFSTEANAGPEQLSLERLADPAQEAEDKIYEEWLLATSAKTITTFSTKLRAAILADLANNSCFDTEPSALQQAFLAAGIHLQDYQRAPSADPAERGRQSALRSLAYKRVAEAHIG